MFEKIENKWTEDSGDYDDMIQKQLSNKRTVSHWTKELKRLLGPEPLRILEVGCGPGFFEIMLGKEGHHVTGIDITENMIHEAKENVKAAGLSADLMTMDCHNLNFPDETFDMVICRNITWTLDDPQKAYKEWLRVLKKGGRLLVSDACWYLHLYDEEKKKIYEAHDAAMWEKYGRGIHAHEDAETGKELSSKLFMSDKKRPAWDLDHMMEIGFSKVFALKDISDISRTSMDRELNKLTPQFLVGGEK